MFTQNHQTTFPIECADDEYNVEDNPKTESSCDKSKREAEGSAWGECCRCCNGLNIFI